MNKPVKPSHLLVLVLAALLTSACATTESASKPEPSNEFDFASSYIQAVNRQAREQNVWVYWINPPR